MAQIDIQNIAKSYDTIKAVDNITLSIDKGEFFFLLGSSGCGKTTLLRIIAGFIQPDQGDIFFNEKKVTHIPPHKRNTGMVFQNYALWPHMNIYENIAFGLKMHGLTNIEQEKRVKKALQMVQMPDSSERYPNQLSGGQQQRIALARALVLEPEIVLLDEPLSNLDAKLRLEMREQIKQLHRRLGLTMLYVTHDQSEALSLADRIAIMHNGKISQIGSPREIYNRPVNRFVAQFVGETNLIKGEVRSIGEQITVQTAIGDLHSSVKYKDVRLGDPVYCSIRPERLGVLSNGHTHPNTIVGKVIRIVYLGGSEQYFIEMKSGDQLKATEYSIDAEKAETGKTTKVGCDPGDVVLLKREAE